MEETGQQSCFFSQKMCADQGKTRRINSSQCMQNNMQKQKEIKKLNKNKKTKKPHKRKKTYFFIMGRPLTDRDIEDINEGFKDMSRETLINTIIFFAVFFLLIGLYLHSQLLFQ